MPSPSAAAAMYWKMPERAAGAAGAAGAGAAAALAAATAEAADDPPP